MTAIDFNDSFAYTSEGTQDNGPTMQWATGLQATNRQIITGWLIPTGQDDDLDMALLAKDAPQTTIKHSSGKTVTHWHLERAELLLVATDTSGPKGVWFAWQALDDGRQQSKLKCRVYVRALVEAGYRHSLLISVKSTLTTDLKKAFGSLYDMSTATKKPIPIYAWWLPTTTGADVARGKSQTKTIAPMIADVPSEFDREWLVNHYAARDKALLAQIEAELPAVIAWSAETTSEPATENESPITFPEKNPAVAAEQRVYQDYGRHFRSRTWISICDFMQWEVESWKPTTADDWDNVHAWITTRLQEQAA